MWELSMLLLHYKLPHFQPILDEFKLSESHESLSNYNNSEVGIRTNPSIRANSGKKYNAFKAQAIQKFSRELDRQNNLDIKLFEVVVANMCNDLHEYGLWNYDIVREYWQKKSPNDNNICKTVRNGNRTSY